MAKRIHWIIILGILLLSSVWSVYAAEPVVEFEVRDRDGYQDIIVTTPLANYLFTEEGGSLRSILLTFAPYGSNVAELVAGTTSNADTFNRVYIESAEFPFELANYDGLTYTASAPLETDEGTLILEFIGQGEGLTVAKRFTIDPEALYTIDVEVEVSGVTEPALLTLTAYTASTDNKGRQLTYLFDGEPSAQPLARGSYFDFQGIGLMDDEIVFFLHPAEGTTVSPFAENTDAGTRRIGVELEESKTYNFTLYGGRRRFITLEAAGIEELDQTGFFARLMVYVIKFLNWLYLKTGNFGWAIILFTILMRLLLFPLMRKQYHSMARIQQIQPKLKKIQERYKDNREEMQKRTLEIYRKEKVNPMSGCFPMVIQLPIIIIIWRALLYASELIHLSPGFLWLPDLSLHDPYFILVILTTAVMVAQQYFMSPMTTPDAKGPQKYMGYFFPILMAVLLWRFPSGLWLYYLLTTAAQVGQQAFVNWEMARAGGGTVSVEDDEIDIDVLPPEDSNGDAA